MTTEEFNTLFDSLILPEIKRMRDSGQKEYAHDTSDVFANFNRIANLLDVDRKKILMTYALKHVDGITAFIKGYTSQREGISGRITDLIVYLILLWAIIEEERSQNERPSDIQR